MKKVVIFSAIIAGLAGIGYGLYRFYKKQIDLALSYCYKISGAKFNTVTKNRINLDLMVKILNNSAFQADLTGYDFDVFINGKFIAKIAGSKAQSIASKGVSELGLNIDFNPDKVFNADDLMKLITWYFTDKANVVIQVRGSFSVRLNFIKVSEYPIDVKMSLADITAPEDPKKPKQICNIQ
jgi:LEA14-like dessication related protein